MTVADAEDLPKYGLTAINREDELATLQEATIDLKGVSNSLQPSGAVLFILAIKATPDKVATELSQYGDYVARTSLSEEDEAALRQAIEHLEVKASAADHLELT